MSQQVDLKTLQALNYFNYVWPSEVAETAAIYFEGVRITWIEFHAAIVATCPHEFDNDEGGYCLDCGMHKGAV